MSTTTFGTPATWARDFSLLGLASGTLAPLFVIFDPWFALAAGFAGASTGVLVGAGIGLAVNELRSRVPLAVWCAAAAVVGAMWGATVGLIGGAAAAATGSVFGEAAVLLGFIVGSTSGMVGLGLFFPLYLVAVVSRRSTLPVVGAGMMSAPVLGWLGIAGLIASTFGIWLFMVPLVVWVAVLVDRSKRLQISNRTTRYGRSNDTWRPAVQLSIG